ncbi:aspartate aminotransferase family protein [Vulcanisaeta distributa]|uniref:Putative [LysW]-aminoadipate semialdehyde/glutamate semialdehyde transaminase n=1 Tax=Vulcanisaeta distributa (strain DSM 14429 / JCM 11212 / NBRC 100878 / IC-017) TaxID=572478 RepID=E1QSU3_VULDI|nr:aspartate aminotransferase family protein [Vulcanisaeta distributa]ADN49610.1 Acetylornithine transaminase [Vulcanisaeta distributa DSM 14429]
MSNDLLRFEDEYLARYYSKKPINVVRGYMQYVWDSNNNKYLDMHTGFGVAFLGHRNPRIINAIKDQLDRIITVPLTFYNEARAEFIREFMRIVPSSFGKVFLQNSGTEAVEVALKIARKISKKAEFLAFLNSFHGRTMGSLSVTGNEKYRKAFEPMPYKVRFAPFNAVDQVDKLVTEDLAAVIVEPIQGEGGVNPAKPEFLRALRQVTRERNVLLIFDEVQTGFGRTGRVWAFENYGVEPDIFTAGKSIAGGLPIGVAVVRREFGDVFEPGEHGSTFAGNPLVMAAAKAGVEVLINDNVPERVRAVGDRFMRVLEDELNGSKTVLRVKGMGLMLGVELRKRADPYIDRLIGMGLLTSVAGGTTVRLLPPYCITDEDLDMAVRALKNALSDSS